MIEIYIVEIRKKIIRLCGEKLTLKNWNEWAYLLESLVLESYFVKSLLKGL